MENQNTLSTKSFKNALIQNIAAGNTIVLNRPARDIVVESLICDKYISHDWWCYQIITAAGGEVIYDTKKSVRYRQHRQNLIGGNDRIVDKLQRLNSFFSGFFKSWIDVNISNLNKNRHLIKRAWLEILDIFIKA